ncbi:MAG: VWA domain-containing protein [Thiotrichales bacterium]
MINQFHFLEPLWWLALLPLAFAVWRLARHLRSDQASPWHRQVDAHLLPYLVVESGGRRGFGWALAALACGGILAIAALAAPAWERMPQPVYRSPVAAVVVLELDSRMLAADLAPNRLERARFAIEDLLNRARDTQFALVAYAGDAFAVTPLTDDAATLKAQLRVLHPDLMPESGTRPERGLALAAELLRQSGRRSGQIVLIASDGGGARTLERARSLAAEGFATSVIAAGQPRNAELEADAELGLDPSALSALAAAGGGQFFLLGGGDVAAQLNLGGAETRIDADASAGDQAERWLNRGPWLLLPLLLLAALAFRRGWLVGIAWGVVGPLLLTSAPGASALDWRDLWQRADQQAHAALDAGDYARARERATDPARHGAAAYRAGDYAAAVDAFAREDDATAAYNRGNALARLGRFDEALASYDAALGADPGFEDARFNRELVESLRKQQEQPPQSGQDAPPAGSDGEESQRDPGNDSAEGTARDDAESDGDPAAPGVSAEATDTADAPASGSDAADAAAQQQQADETVAEAREQAREPSAQDSDPSEMAADHLSPEQRQSVEQYLRRVPDDPGGLLRRKFLYQYQQRAREPGIDDERWRGR